MVLSDPIQVSISKMDNNQNQTRQFLGLLIPNQKRIYAFILYLVPRHNDAEDILQETLAEMWHKFDQFQPGSDFVAWGVTIAKYKILSWKQKQTKGKLVFNPETEALIESETPENINQMQEHLVALKDCMGRLPARDKDIIRQRYEDNKTLAAISTGFGISLQAVHKTICRIHARLVRCIRLSLQSGERA